MVRTKKSAKKPAKPAMPAKKSTTRGSASASGTDNVNDADLSFAQLADLPREVLRLKCLDLKLLTTGKPKQLAARIFEEYHPTQVDPPPDVFIGDDDAPLADLQQNTNDTDKTISYVGSQTRIDADSVSDDDQSDDQRSVTSNATYITRRDPGRHSSPEPDEDEVRINLHEVVQAVVEKSLGEEVRTMNAQVQAIHSQLAAMKNQQKQPDISTKTPSSAVRTSPRKRKSDDTTTKNTSTSSRRSPKRSRQDTGKQQQTQRTSNSKTGTGTSLFSFPTLTLGTNKQSAPRNRFTLPAIDKKFLDSIEKGEYVDFDKMKKKKADTKSRETNRTDYNVKLDDTATDSTTLRLKKSTKETINSFQEWMAVWNDFIHARLHFHPTEAYDLLKYQKHITDFAKQYKFEAVRNYDIDFRHLIANQRSESPNDRTAFWDQHNIELKNLLLAEHPKPPPHCYNCNEKGHISNECPKPAKKQNTYNKNHNTTYTPTSYPSFHTPPPPPPPPSQPQQQNQGRSTNAAPANLDRNDPDNYCRALNATGACPRGFRCRWLHICNKCRWPDHGGIRCPNHTSTPFRG